MSYEIVPESEANLKARKFLWLTDCQGLLGKEVGILPNPGS